MSCGLSAQIYGQLGHKNANPGLKEKLKKTKKENARKGSKLQKGKGKWMNSVFCIEVKFIFC